MKRIALLSLALLGAATAAISLQGERVPVSAPAATRSGGVHELLYARPFRLAEPYASAWRADGLVVAAGWLVVLAVDPALVEPRSELEPVLYAGDTTVERVNHGHESGRVVGVLPIAGPLDGTPFWFGAPELPERVTAATVAAERAAAAGVGPVGAAREVGELAELADRGALRREAARLVLEWSPAERELAEGMLAPVVGR